MHALQHLAGAILFCVAFFAGKMLAERRETLAQKLLARIRNRESASNFFLYSGKTIETVSAVGAFVEVVAVVVLAS